MDTSLLRWMHNIARIVSS